IEAAAFHGHVDIVKTLMSRCTLNGLFQPGYAIQAAVLGRHWNIYKLLVSSETAWYETDGPWELRDDISDYRKPKHERLPI
ncbi:hypothetical protein DF186_22950, partial [Enterococcus hirae]